MIFKRKCPSCEAQSKIVSRCRHCFKLICSECSVHGMCIDCYTTQESAEEIDHYFEDKYENGIIC